MNRRAGTRDGNGLDTIARRILAGRVRQLLVRRKDTIGRGDPDSIHDVRVATRRLQEALDLFAPILPGRERERLRRRARRVRRQLAALRDADVLAGLATALPEGSALVPDLVLQPLTLRIRAKSSRGGVRVPGLERRSRELLDALRKAVAHDPAQAARLVNDARTAMRHRAAAVGAALRGVRVGRAADAHRLRLAVKRYRYTMELLAQAGLASPGAAIEEARRVQESLGRLHDLDILLALLRRRRSGRRLLAPLGKARRARAAEARALLASFRPWRMA